MLSSIPPAARAGLGAPKLRRVARLTSVIVLAAGAAGARPAVAQELDCDPGDLEVRRVVFDGNRVFRDAELANATATTPSNWSRRVGLPFGKRRCLDSLELQRDVYRLRAFYRQHGYHKAHADTTIRLLQPGAIAVTFRLTEGPPVLIDSISVAGLDTVPDGDRLVRRVEAFRGRPFDRVRLQAEIDSIVERLHDNGYAHAEQPLLEYDVDTPTDRAVVRLTFLPGRIARVGRIVYDISPPDSGERVQIDSSTVRRLLSFRPGDVFRERSLFQSQRDLYQLDAYRHVEVAPLPDSLQPPGDSLLVVLVRLAERDRRSVRAGLGWATLDCVRTQVRYTDRDFLGGARRLELNGRVSKIGRGEPLGGGGAICTGDIRNDPFSSKLNYYAGATLRQPTLFGPRNVPTIALYSERRSEFRAYQRTTPVGFLGSVTRELRQRLPLTLAFQIERGRTTAEEAVFCSVFNYCDLVIIRQLQEPSRLGVVSASLVRDRTDNPFDPTRGSQARIELRHSSSLTGSDSALHFNKWLGEAAFYHGTGRGGVLAARVQAGGVLALGSLQGAQNFVPPQERLYAGGPNSVRGYNQNELGPVVYIVETYSVVDSAGTTMYRADPRTVRILRASPTGGNALVIANLEWRVRCPALPELLRCVLFTDGGQVYNRTRETLRLGDLKWTPGVGLRVASPVGPLRLDVAYNGYPRRAGAAYFVQPPDVQPRALLCVSPDNVFKEGIGNPCPQGFAPPPRRTFFSRLTFHFSIGQAF